MEESAVGDSSADDPVAVRSGSTLAVQSGYRDRAHFLQQLPNIRQSLARIVRTHSHEDILAELRTLMIHYLVFTDDPLAKSALSNIFQFVCFAGINEVLSYVISASSYEPEFSFSNIAVAGLCLAAAQGHIPVCQTLIKHNIIEGFSRPDQTGHLAIEYAIERGRLDIVRFMLDCGMEINIMTSHQVTPLFLATKVGHVLIMEEFIFRGADLTVTNQQGRTIFEVAASHDSFEVIITLIAHMKTTSIFEKAATAAVCTGALSNLKLILQKAKEKNIRLSLSFLLATSASKGQNTICSYLTESGADVNSVRENGVTALFRAIRNQHLTTCRLLIQLGANIEHKCHDQHTPLHYACGIGDEKIVSLLLESGASFDQPDSTGFWPLHYAAHRGAVACCELLVKRGANVEAKHTQQTTALHWASSAGRHETVRYLLSVGAQVDSLDADGSTPLLWASEHGHIDCIRALLEYRADVNITDRIGASPLSTACSHGHEKILDYLLDRGANIRATDVDGKTCLHIAAERGQIGCIKNLLSKPVDLNTKDSKGKLPVHYAAMSGSLDTLLLLLNPSNVNTQDNGGMTVFHWIVQTGLSSAISHLLKMGARLDIVDIQHNDPLLVALKSRNLKCAAILVELGANVQSTDSLMQTPLHMACYIGNAKFVLLLLQNGANVDCISSEGYTALHLAASEGHQSVIDVLSQFKANVSIKDGNGRTAFDYATAAGHVSCIPRLMEIDSAHLYHKPSALDDEIMEIVMGFIKEGSATFNVKHEKDSINTILLTPKKVKLQKSGKTRTKEKYSFSIEISLDSKNDKSFSITLDGKKVYKLNVDNSTQRYIVAMTIRIFRIYSLKPKPLVVAVQHLQHEETRHQDPQKIHNPGHQQTGHDSYLADPMSSPIQAAYPRTTPSNSRDSQTQSRQSASPGTWTTPISQHTPVPEKRVAQEKRSSGAHAETRPVNGQSSQERLFHTSHQTVATPAHPQFNTPQGQTQHTRSAAMLQFD